MQHCKDATPAAGNNSEMPSWLTPRTDHLLSFALTYLAMILGGYGLFVATQQWLPSGIVLIAIALVIQHIAMTGLRAQYQRILQQADSS